MNTTPPTLAQDIHLRRQRLQEAMQDRNIEACILATAVNVYYMTGCIYNGYFYLPAQGDAIHFVKRPQGIDLANTTYIRKPEQLAEELQKRNLALPQSLLLETDVLPFGECNRLLATLHIERPANASTLLREIRSVKSDYELAQIRACAAKHAAVYTLIPALYTSGMTDIAFQIEIEHLMRQQGSLGIFRSYGQNMDIYMGSLLAGDNAAVASPFDFALGGAGINPMMPLGAAGNPLQQGQTIMVDMAGNYTPWMTDMTRIFAVGKPPALAYKAHAVSLAIQDAIMHVAKPSVACATLYNIATDMVKKEGLEAYFMGTNQQAAFIGHGLGLEINEPPVLSPRSREVLEENTVFALEPKFVLPHIGAVGIENTFVVTASGIEKLSICEEEIVIL